MTAKALLRTFFLFALLSCIPAFHSRAFASIQEHSSPSGTNAGGDELLKEEHEEEEHENLKHSAVIQKLAKVTGLTVHQAHLLAVCFNFALIVFFIYWFGRKSIPATLRNRSQSIQQALAEARTASQDANRRLAEIEARLSKLDVEIGAMQTSSEKEAEAEDLRIKKATEDDIRKVVETAEQEIAAAAKQARRELKIYTADLAVTLARKQIQVDPPTDETLVRNFAGRLSSGSSGSGSSGSGSSGKERQ